MPRAQELAFKVLENLVTLKEARELQAQAFGDDRGCYYPGDIEREIKELAIQVLKERNGGYSDGSS